MIYAKIKIAGMELPAKVGLMSGDKDLLPLVDTPEKERAAKALFDYIGADEVELISAEEYRRLSNEKAY